MRMARGDLALPVVRVADMLQADGASRSADPYRCRGAEHGLQRKGVQCGHRDDRTANNPSWRLREHTLAYG